MINSNAYKCEWAKGTPANWQRIPLESIFSFGKGLSITKSDLLESGYPVISYGQVHAKECNGVEVSNDLVRYVSEIFFDSSPGALVQKNDIIVADTSEDIAGCGNAVRVSTDNPIFSGYHTITMKTRKDLDTKYIAYLMRTEAWREQIVQQLTEVKLYSITQATLKNTYILLPPVDVQQQIVNYLDKMSTQINEAISRHEQIIEKLGEYRLSLITNVISKGLRGEALKETSYKYMPSIPLSWDIMKATRLVDENHPYPIGDGDHGSIKSKDYKEYGIPFIRVQNLGFATELNLDNVVYIDEDQNASIQNSTLRPDDVIFAKTGATIGKTAIIPESMPIANTTSHVGKITVSKKHCPKYAFYVLSSNIGYVQMWSIAEQKSTRPELSIDEVKSLLFPVPPTLEEEQEIADYLDEQSQKVFNAIQRQKQAIERLKEYQKSIIFNAVTGKIDCRKES